MTSSKTVCIVINTSWNIYNFRMGLIKSLQKDGYNIITIAPTDAYSKKLEALGFEYHNIDINNKGTNPFEDIKLILKFYQLYKKINPDLLLHYTIKPNIYGTIAARLAGIPVISNISGLGTVFLNNNVSSKIAKILYKIALKIPSRVFFQNKDDLDLFLQLKLASKRKTEVLPGSGIDTTKLVPIQMDAPNLLFTFLFIARLVKDKGLLEYINAARIVKAKHSKVKFVVLGAFYPGNPTAITEIEMNDWVDEGLIQYMGVSDNVPFIISNADCVVLPSYREGLSRVLLEAASMEKPIITTDVPGCRDVVDDGVNGFLCRSKDEKDLSLKMEKMLKFDSDKLVQMGKEGRKKVIEEFDESLVINSYKKAITMIIGNGA